MKKKIALIFMTVGLALAVSVVSIKEQPIKDSAESVVLPLGCPGGNGGIGGSCTG